MTKPDEIQVAEDIPDAETNSNELGRRFLRAALMIGIGSLLIIALGIVVSFTSGILEKGTVSFGALGVVTGLLGLIALVVFGLWKLWPDSGEVDLAPSTRRASRWLKASFLAGVLSGLAYALTNNNSALALYSNGSLATAPAIVLVVGWITALIISWFWFRSIDEHERAANDEGAIVAMCVYVGITPIWWAASRAGWISPQDPMIMLLIVSAVWGAIWFYRRFT